MSDKTAGLAVPLADRLRHRVALLAKTTGCIRTNLNERHAKIRHCPNSDFLTSFIAVSRPGLSGATQTLNRATVNGKEIKSRMRLESCFVEASSFLGAHPILANQNYSSCCLFSAQGNSANGPAGGSHQTVWCWDRSMTRLASRVLCLRDIESGACRPGLPGFHRIQRA